VAVAAVSGLTPGKFERARSWLPELAATFLLDGTTWSEDAHGERKYSDTGFGLSINTRTAEWWSFAAADGGISPLKFIRLLRPEYTQADVEAALLAFLAAHPGTGSAGAAAPGDADAPPGTARALANAAAAREALDHMVAGEGTDVDIYTNSRGIPDYPPDTLFYLPDARIGEGALVVKLVAHRRTTGVLLTYLTPFGSQSLVKPVRRRLDLEPAKGAAFVIPPPADLVGTLDMLADIIICEGVEDALSLALLRRSATIYGLPGIAALAHFEVRA
jgi:hypothetical protein